MLSKTKRNHREFALQMAVDLTVREDRPLDICPGVIIDTAKFFEEYILTGINSAHSIHDNVVSNNLQLVKE